MPGRESMAWVVIYWSKCFRSARSYLKQLVRTRTPTRTHTHTRTAGGPWPSKFGRTAVKEHQGGGCDHQLVWSTLFDDEQEIYSVYVIYSIKVYVIFILRAPFAASRSACWSPSEAASICIRRAKPSKPREQNLRLREREKRCLLLSVETGARLPPMIIFLKAWWL